MLMSRRISQIYINFLLIFSGIKKLCHRKGVLSLSRMFIVVPAYFSISEIHCFYVIYGYESRYLELNTHDFSTKSDGSAEQKSEI